MNPNRAAEPVSRRAARDRTTTEGIEPRQAIAAPRVRPFGRMLIVLENGVPLLRCLDDQLGDLLRERQHRDVARRHLDRRSLGRLHLVAFHLRRNDRILRRNDHVGRLLAPRGLAHRSGKGSDVKRSLRRRYDCLFFGRKVGSEISLDALFADREIAVRVLDERFQASGSGYFEEALCTDSPLSGA